MAAHRIVIPGGWPARHRWSVLAAAVAFLVLSGVFGAPGVASLQSGGNDDPSSPSSIAAAALVHDFGRQPVDLVLLLTAADGSVDSPATALAALQVRSRVTAVRGVTVLASYWPNPDVRLRSRSGAQATMLLTLAGNKAAQDAELAAVKASLPNGPAAVQVQLGGPTQTGSDIGSNVGKSLGLAEGISIPVTLILLVFAFGAVVAGVLPLAMGAVAILGTLLVLRVLTLVTDVSIYSLNLATALGLGLAIDYSLLIVNRYREELARTGCPDDALRTTLRTAGRTVAFSAVTVAAALSSLLVFPGYFLKSFGYSGIAVVAIAAIASLTVLPALLRVLGHRTEKFALPWQRRRQARPAVDPARNLFGRCARAAFDRPAATALAVVMVLLAMGIPALGIRFGNPDQRVLPTSAPSRLVADAVAQNFATAPTEALTVLGRGPTARAATDSQIGAYAARLATVSHVVRVDSAAGSFGPHGRLSGPDPALRSAAGTRLSVYATAGLDSSSAAGQQLVHDVRSAAAPFATLVTGDAATLVDTKAAIAHRLPWAAGIIVVVTLVVLFLFTGSVFIPVKALLVNLVSLSAVFGAIVMVFQYGHLSGLLGFTPTGTTDLSMPILMFCVTFGLSMDYEVFLLSRITEEYRRSGDTRTAVILGIGRSGRIITTAATLMAVVFLAFGTATVSFLQLFGLGAALAVIIDATVIRCLLVPAVMGLAGGANWWAPAVLLRLHNRIGLRDAEETLDDYEENRVLAVSAVR
jgi:putative drug exporter of the RND superfamily